MNVRLRRALSAGLCAAPLACGILLPDSRTPLDRAREVAPRCARQADAADAGLLSPSLVESVEPAYSVVASGNDRLVHLRGARLRLRPLPGVSVEAIQRALECHQVRVTMGTEGELPSDPYVLPGAWLDVTVESVGDGFLAAVRADGFDRAQSVLDRARGFVASRR